MSDKILVQGIFVADLAFWSERLPNEGETFIGENFHINPGGKGSNQAVAAQRAGGQTALMAKVGKDTFGEMARQFYREEGVSSEFVFESETAPTGAAAISIVKETGKNSIIVVPGAGAELNKEEVHSAKNYMQESKVFLTQLETPLPVTLESLRLAVECGAQTILNPAPAATLTEEFFKVVDYFTPNEVEAEMMSGVKVIDEESAHKAADYFMSKGVSNVLITMGEKGVFVKTRELAQMIPAVSAGEVIDTTGAGDVFNGAFAAALTEGMSIVDSVRFANKAAGISVTRVGTAKSAPLREEIDSF